MGTLITFEGGTIRMTSIDERRCLARVVSGGARLVQFLCKLELSRECPLMSYTRGFAQLPVSTVGNRSGHAALLPDKDVSLAPGVWEVNTGSPAWLLVGVDSSAVEVSRARAFCELGAVQVLEALGLGDAAVALAAGQYDYASVQWIAERERRLGLGSV